MKKLVLISILLLTILSSCYYSFYPQTGSIKHPETSPEMIKVYSGDLNKDYKVIGSVSAIAIGDADAAAKLLKKKAAKLGADAIVKVDMSKTSSTSLRTCISGVAVRLNKSKVQANN